MSKPIVDITPKNGAGFPWGGQDANKFEQEWSMKPVVIRGYLDHNKEIKIEKKRNGERGVEVVTPFYTHLDKNDQPCGILINRGWLAWDLKNFRHDRLNEVTSVTGILYRGDASTKYSKPNQPLMHRYQTVKPEEIAVVNQLPNEEEAGNFMIHAVDFDESTRTIHPNVPTSSELQSFTNSAERHEAYERMWNGLTYVGVLANTAMWLYL